MPLTFDATNRGKMEFKYEVIRLWETPGEQFLSGDLGLMPLAVLGLLPPEATVEEGLASIVRRLIDRLLIEAQVDQGRRLLTATFVLTGLRVRDKNAALQLFKGVRAMRESVTYMAIIDEGRVEEARNIILRLGRKRFGPPDEATTAALSAMEDVERLESLCERVLDAKNWYDFLKV